MTLQTSQPFAPLKTWMAGIGDFFFKWRNQAFPLILLAIYILRPPSNRVAGSQMLEHARDALAIGLVLLGLSLRLLVIGLAYIKRGGVGKKVYAADLVTSGMFGVCRNPLYVGNLIIVAGILTMHGDALAVAAGGLAMGFIYQSIVYAEERYLATKFGDGHGAYCADVPRWGFRLSRLADAVQGMRFDLGKAILADYATIATSGAILAVTEIYEQLAHPDDPPSLPLVWTLALGIVVAAVWTSAVRAYKKDPTRRRT